MSDNHDIKKIFAGWNIYYKAHGEKSVDPKSKVNK